MPRESVTARLERLWILGIPVTPFESYAQAVQHVARIVRARRKSLCVAINPEKVRRALNDPELRTILRRADICICDGIGVALAARVLRGRKIKRCTGVDLFLALMAAAAREGWTAYLLGASEESNATAAARLCARYPGLRIVGRQHGYFEDSERVVAQVNASGADLLFVALGSPRQERWMAAQRAALATPFCMGVGGTFNVVSGAARRAPAICRRTGTEFVYRLLTDPRRLKRQLALPVFASMVLKQTLLRTDSTAWR